MDDRVEERPFRLFLDVLSRLLRGDVPLESLHAPASGGLSQGTWSEESVGTRMQRYGCVVAERLAVELLMWRPGRA